MSDPEQPQDASPPSVPSVESAPAPVATETAAPAAEVMSPEPTPTAVEASDGGASPTTASEPTTTEASASDASTTDTGAGDDGEGEGDEGGDESTEPSTPGTEAAPGDPTKKKRRRRRKKKTSAGGEVAPGAEGVEAAPGPDGAPRPPREPREPRERRPPKRDTSHAPFVRFIDHTSIAARRHMFAVGEIVAGRVKSVEDGLITLDLWGKGTAFVDAAEPREIAPLPEKQTASGDVHAPEAHGELHPEGEPSPELLAEAAAVEADRLAKIAAEEAAHPEPEPPPPAGEGEGAEGEQPAAEAAAPVPPEEPHEDPEAAAEAAHAAELAAAPPAPPPPAVGSVFRGRIAAIAESGTLALMNRPRDGQAARARVEDARSKHQRVNGIVYGFNRGGYDVFIDGLRAFCPASGMSLWAIDDPATLVGKKLPFSIPPTKPGAHGLVVSRRAILEREARKEARDRIKSLGVGARIKGRVTQIRDFGLFVDIGGGLEGMVHVSELSWDRIAKPGDVVRVGDEIETQILKIPDGRKERHERVGLSLRAALPDPWDQHAELVAEGRAFKGKVVRVAEFGAFVEVAPGIDGLLHVTELGQKLAHAKEAVKEGDEVPVVIERADRKARRLSLSKLSPADAKALEAGTLAPVEAVKRPKPGTHLKVKVERVEHHGVFVQLVGVVGKRGRGYIPNNEMATERGTDHRKLFPVGKEIDVKIIGEDRDGSLKCSRKGFMFDEEKRAVSEYRKEASKQGFGTFGDLLRAKIGGGGGDAPKT